MAVIHRQFRDPQAETLLTLAHSKSMGPPPLLWRPQPRRHCPVRGLLHTAAYSQPAAAQIRNSVRMLSDFLLPSTCDWRTIHHLRTFSDSIMKRGCATLHFLALLPRNFSLSIRTLRHRINVRHLRHEMILQCLSSRPLMQWERPPDHKLSAVWGACMGDAAAARSCVDLLHLKLCLSLTATRIRILLEIDRTLLAFS